MLPTVEMASILSKWAYRLTETTFILILIGLEIDVFNRNMSFVLEVVCE